MSNVIHISATTKEGRYKELIPQVKSLLNDESDTLANMANFCAVLRELPGFFWVGFYLIKNNELVLGPFQGPVACTRIQKGKGVCGTAWKKNQCVIVEDVARFPGHIACSSLSKSEIVIPVYTSHHEMCGVLDIDSELPAHFDKTDEQYLKELLSFIKF